MARKGAQPSRDIFTNRGVRLEEFDIFEDIEQSQQRWRQTKATRLGAKAGPSLECNTDINPRAKDCRSLVAKVGEYEILENNSCPTPPNWREFLRQDIREIMVNRIMETVKKYRDSSPTSKGLMSLDGLRQLASHFEKKEFLAATSEPNYFQNISLRMLARETNLAEDLAMDRKARGTDNQIGQDTDVQLAQATDLQDPGDSASIQTISDGCLRTISWLAMARKTGGIY